MKSLSNTLSKWSIEEFGGIFKKVREFEGQDKEVEEKLIQNNNVTKSENLHEIYAKYIRYLKLEGSIM